jgi:hypothetical protein
MAKRIPTDKRHSIDFDVCALILQAHFTPVLLLWIWLFDTSSSFPQKGLEVRNFVYLVGGTRR